MYTTSRSSPGSAATTRRFSAAPTQRSPITTNDIAGALRSELLVALQALSEAQEHRRLREQDVAQLAAANEALLQRVEQQDAELWELSEARQDPLVFQKQVAELQGRNSALQSELDARFGAAQPDTRAASSAASAAPPSDTLTAELRAQIVARLDAEANLAAEVDRHRQSSKLLSQRTSQLDAAGASERKAREALASHEERLLALRTRNDALERQCASLDAKLARSEERSREASRLAVALAAAERRVAEIESVLLAARSRLGEVDALSSRLRARDEEVASLHAALRRSTQALHEQQEGALQDRQARAASAAADALSVRLQLERGTHERQLSSVAQLVDTLAAEQARVETTLLELATENSLLRMRCQHPGGGLEAAGVRSPATALSVSQLSQPAPASASRSLRALLSSSTQAHPGPTLPERHVLSMTTPPRPPAAAAAATPATTTVTAAASPSVLAVQRAIHAAAGTLEKLRSQSQHHVASADGSPQRPSRNTPGARGGATVASAAASPLAQQAGGEQSDARAGTSSDLSESESSRVAAAARSDVDRRQRSEGNDTDSGLAAAASLELTFLSTQADKETGLAGSYSPGPALSPISNTTATARAHAAQQSLDDFLTTQQDQGPDGEYGNRLEGAATFLPFGAGFSASAHPGVAGEDDHSASTPPAAVAAAPQRVPVAREGEQQQQWDAPTMQLLSLLSAAESSGVFRASANGPGAGEEAMLQMGSGGGGAGAGGLPSGAAIVAALEFMRSR